MAPAAVSASPFRKAVNFAKMNEWIGIVCCNQGSGRETRPRSICLADTLLYTEWCCGDDGVQQLRAGTCLPAGEAPLFFQQCPGPIIISPSGHLRCTPRPGPIILCCFVPPFALLPFSWSATPPPPQVAADMHGTPLPLPQWLYIDLQDPCIATSIQLDWETAFASAYVIDVSSDAQVSHCRTSVLSIVNSFAIWLLPECNTLHATLCVCEPLPCLAIALLRGLGCDSPVCRRDTSDWSATPTPITDWYRK